MKGHLVNKLENGGTFWVLRRIITQLIKAIDEGVTFRLK